uniref:Intraflagellar transport protein 56 n=1 Tax=Syphacia muris TaxID=451379 RepID=A0A0N5AQW9_9BILA
MNKLDIWGDDEVRSDNSQNSRSVIGIARLYYKIKGLNDVETKERGFECLLSKFFHSKSRINGETEAASSGIAAQSGTITELDNLLSKRDYTGAISLFEFHKREGKNDVSTDLWMSYCAFHAGQYSKAVQVYEDLIATKEAYPPETEIFLACAYYFLNQLEKAKQHAEQGYYCPKIPLRNRLLLHIYNKLGDEANVKKCHSELCDTNEDVLSLAAIHFQRSHYQEALDSYKKLLSESKHFLALNVYLALCYYKLEYYDVALWTDPDSVGFRAEASSLSLCTVASPKPINITRIKDTIQLYLSQFPDSPFAINVQACARYRLYNSKAADRELLRVVFHDGDGALITLPSLVNEIPESRLNLIKFHLQRDTVAGRQAMASAHFLLNQLDEALIYLDSIKEYFEDDDVFSYNYGQVLLANNRSAEAEDVLQRISDPLVRKRFVYTMCLVRCYCENGKGDLAWALCSKLKHSDGLTKVYEVIANECYKAGDYYHSALAFDALCQLQSDEEFWNGKKNAIFGIIRNVMDATLPK